MKGKICKNCESCKQLYKKQWFWFHPKKKFMCVLRGEITEPANTCERYTPKDQKPYDLSPERFGQAERDIEYLMEKLKDE